MRRSVFHSLVFTAAAAVLCSCEILSVVPRHVRFNEADFTAFGAPGSGVVMGRAAGVFEDKVSRVGDHATVKLMPDNAYTEEIEKVTFRQPYRLPPPDPGFAKYVREVKTDGTGNFVFSQLPPGNYYVTCRFAWPYHSTHLSASDDTYVETDDTAEQTLYAKVTVRHGQTVRVGTWDLSIWFATPLP